MEHVVKSRQTCPPHFMGRKIILSSWNRRVWGLSWPIILANLTVPLPGAVDTAVLGHLDHEAYLGAMSLNIAIFSFLYYGFVFLRMGLTGPTAQARGAGDSPEVRAILFRGLGLAVGISSLILLLQGLIALLVFPLFGASAGVEAVARDYYHVRIWGTPAALVSFVLTGWFLGLGSARIPMTIQIVANSLNMVLDVWFVLGLGWGAEGAAAATVVGDYAGMAVGLLMVWRHSRTWPAGGLDWRRVGDTSQIRRMMGINANIFLRTLCLLGAFALFAALGARLGDDVLAANAILLNFFYFASFGLDGIAHATETLAGDAVGRRSRRDLTAIVRAALILGFWIAAGAGLIYWLAGGPLIRLFTSLPDIRDLAQAHLGWVVALPLLSVWCFIFDGVFLGATWTRELRNMMLLSSAVFVAAAYGFTTLWGSHGLWLSFLLFMALRGATLWIRWPVLARRVG